MRKDARKRCELIRTFLLTVIAEAAGTISASTLRKAGAAKFGISERSIDSHIRYLSDQGCVELRKAGRLRICLLKDLQAKRITFDLSRKENQDDRECKEFCVNH